MTKGTLEKNIILALNYKSIISTASLVNIERPVI
jgi:hypothetical protein